jgi:hypothetical protein
MELTVKKINGVSEKQADYATKLVSDGIVSILAKIPEGKGSDKMFNALQIAIDNFCAKSAAEIIDTLKNVMPLAKAINDDFKKNMI